ncbi:hypothetical protein AC579_8984 [Pseudocercospora musae]|uniref:Uncharacterized protein n=1 Tax=Pseudocercospora musae TaxID=113226 RepID=A0A139HNZ3_9PEZI|nr:hypothetical protein AC579_8984 [Pseudocercospora musae]
MPKRQTLNTIVASQVLAATPTTTSRHRSTRSAGSRFGVAATIVDPTIVAAKLRATDAAVAGRHTEFTKPTSRVLDLAGVVPIRQHARRPTRDLSCPDLYAIISHPNQLIDQ